MICSALKCGKNEDCYLGLQYVIVDVGLQKERKEYYCQKHLRKRIFQLELMKLAGQVRKEVIEYGN